MSTGVNRNNALESNPTLDCSKIVFGSEPLSSPLLAGFRIHLTFDANKVGTNQDSGGHDDDPYILFRVRRRHISNPPVIV